jgi:hypothetical protein
MSSRRSRKRVRQGAQVAPPRHLEEILEEEFARGVCEPDDRPELEAAVDSAIDRLTRPPTIYARMQVAGLPDRLCKSQRVATTSEAILWMLWRLVQELEVPTRVIVTTDDPTVHRILSTTTAVPSWLRSASDALEYETSLGDVSVSIAPLEPGDRCNEPFGHA